jgi:hypothetical protein
MPILGWAHGLYWIGDGVDAGASPVPDLLLLGVGRVIAPALMFVGLEIDPLISLVGMTLGGLYMVATDWKFKSFFSKKTAKKSDAKILMDHFLSKDGMIAKTAVQKVFHGYKEEENNPFDFDRRVERAYHKARNSGASVAGASLRFLIHYWIGRLALENRW